jgi:hypothetical protein
MHVVDLRLNEDLPQKDYMALDLVYVGRVPIGTSVIVELSRYKGGGTN